MTPSILGRIATGAFVFALSFATASAQSLDNKGDDFLLTFLPNFDSAATTELHLTADSPTSVTVEYPAITPTFTTTVAVAPGTITVVEIPNTAGQAWAVNTVQDNAVRASAADEFACYMVNRRPFSTDAALGLPIDTMNTEFIAISYLALFEGEFAVVAAFDNTTVEITPSTALDGRPAGVPFSIVMNAGEAYFGTALSAGFDGVAGDITGTLITSDRPIGMTNGNRCTNIPVFVTACDHIFEVAQPVQSWGSSTVAVNLPNRTNGSIYRIVASVDGTTVTQDGVAIGMINRGGFIETAELTGSHEFAGTEPIYVVQFMTGASSPGSGGVGDPAMGNMIPSAQYVSDYTFATVGDGQFAQHFLTVVASAADVGAVLLDGTAIPAGDFSPIGASGLSSTVVAIAEGTHTTSSPNPHGITVEGYNAFDSYIYPGAALFQFINPVGDENEPICEVLETTATSLSGRGVDDRPSEDTNGDGVLDPGEDLNGNGLVDEDTGIFFVQLAPGAMNLDLTVDPFIPGDPEATFVAALIDPALEGEGAIVVTDGAGNECVIEVLITPDTGCMHSGLGDIVGVDSGGTPTVFPTIQAALNDFQQEQVLVFTGNYAEELIVWNRTDFILRACGDVTVQRILVKLSQRATIRGFNVDAVGHGYGVFLLFAPYANEDVRLLECNINGDYHGLRVDDGNTITVEDCTISNAVEGFVSGGFGRIDATATFLRTVFSNCYENAAVMSPGMNARFEDCGFFDNAKAGVAMAWFAYFTNEPERVMLINNAFAGNGNHVTPGLSTENIQLIGDIIDATDTQPVF